MPLLNIKHIHCLNEIKLLEKSKVSKGKEKMVEAVTGEPLSLLTKKGEKIEDIHKK